MNIYKTFGFVLACGVVLLGAATLIFMGTFVTTVDKHEFAFIFDRWSGRIEPITNTGWVIRMPVRYAVNTIDLRPVQITISANQRVLNAKLCQFNPAGIDTFIAWHGRDAANWHDDLVEILKCYAFDTANGADCPFLEIIQEIAPNQGFVTNKVQK
jgi:hypothetical protein